MRLRLFGRRRAGIALAALAFVAVVLVPASSANPPSSGVKQFTGCLAKATAPGSCDTSALPGGQSVALTLTIGNAQTSNQALGSVNLDVPSGISIVLSNPAPQYAVGTGGFGTNTSTELQLRNLNLPPGGSVSVNFTVTTPCSGANLKWGPLSSGPQVKQSNNFSGTGNDFTNTGSSGFTSGIVPGANGTPDHIAYSAQPSDAGKGTNISPAVKVTMYDTCGQVTNQADGNSVTLALVQPADQTFGGGGALSGTTLNNDGTVSRPLSSGVATFSDLEVSASGIGYTLDASYPNMSDVTSNAFNVYDSYGPCTSGCQTGNGDTTIQLLGFSGGGNTGLGVGGANNSATCGAGLTALGSTFVIVPPANANGNITAILTIGKRGLQGVGVSNIVVCKNSGPGTPLVKMGPCAKKNPSPPCILSQTSSNAGDAKITMLITPTDPGGSGFG